MGSIDMYVVIALFCIQLTKNVYVLQIEFKFSTTNNALRWPSGEHNT